MTQGKHTPGPWVWATSNSWRRLMRVGGKDGGILCPVVHQYDAHPDLSIPNEADARLIAAAPELLEALKVVTDTLIDWLPRLRGQRDIEEISRAYLVEQIALAQAAIVKAEGAQ